MSGFRTIVVGFGQIADGLRHDAKMAEYFGFATHAQALDAHPAFDWLGVVDPAEQARQAASRDWNVPHVSADLAAVAEAVEPEVAVIATPPGGRAEIIQQLPNLKAVFVEKPIGEGNSDGRAFVEFCRGNGVDIQVNFWRRGDPLFRELAAGKLSNLVGRPQAVFATYGNGLFNNGSHLVDFLRMLLGDVETVQALGDPAPLENPAGTDDHQVAFALTLASGTLATVSPLDFGRYREVGLDIWGTDGRLALLQESLGIFHYPLAENRGLENEMEISSDKPTVLEPTVDRALYDLYDNLAETIAGRAELWSPGGQALHTENILNSVLTSADGGGERLYFR